MSSTLFDLKDVINVSLDKDGIVEYVLVKEGNYYTLYKAYSYKYHSYQYKTVGNRRVADTTKPAIIKDGWRLSAMLLTDESLDAILQLRQNPIKNIPFEFIEQMI